jgi:hypothetical protein
MREAKTTNALRKLIRACVDDERTLLHECKFVGPGYAQALTRMARERGQFVADLERMGQCPLPHDGSWTELSREVGRDIWVTAAGRNLGDAITTCRHSLSRTEARYDEVLQNSWPDEIKDMLEGQRRRLRDETAELIKLEF